MQKIIEKVNAEWIEKVGKTWDAIDEAGKAFALKQGGKVVTLSKQEGESWVKAVQPVLADYVKMTKEKGLPGDEVLKFAVDYLKEHQK
jgi:TRAP-type C4-dicarboxylate transport system substrate-binding protein